MGKILKVLREFIADIDAVGVENVLEEWPDLVETYKKAKAALVADVVEMPNEEDMAKLTALLAKKQYISPTPGDLLEADYLMRNAYVAKFPHYISGSPGYAGPVFVIVFDGAPSFHEVVVVNMRTGEYQIVEKEN